MIVQNRYRESVSPDPAAASGRDSCAMVDGVYMQYTLNSITCRAVRSISARARWTAVQSAGRCSHLSERRRETGLRTPMTCSMLPCIPASRIAYGIAIAQMITRRTQCTVGGAECGE